MIRGIGYTVVCVFLCFGIMKGLTTLGKWAVRFCVLDAVEITVFPSTTLVPCPPFLLEWATLCFPVDEDVDGSCCESICNDLLVLHFMYWTIYWIVFLLANCLVHTELPASSCACFWILTNRLCIIWAGDSLLSGLSGIFLCT